MRFVNLYLTDYIRVADSKATVMLGVVGALLAAVLAQSSHPHAKGIWVYYASVIITIVAIVVQILVIWPRTEFKRRKGLIFWDNISAHDQDDYRQKVSEIDEAGIVIELANQAHNLASTASRKYRILRWAVVFGVVAALVDVLTILGF